MLGEPEQGSQDCVVQSISLPSILVIMKDAKQKVPERVSSVND
jgi:hypothetical protein